MSDNKSKDIDDFFGLMKGGIDRSARRKSIQYSYRIAAVALDFELVNGDSDPNNLYQMGSFYKRNTGHSWHDRKSHPEVYSDPNVKDVAYSCRLKAVDLGHEFAPGDKENYNQLLTKFERHAGHAYQGKLVC